MNEEMKHFSSFVWPFIILGGSCIFYSKASVNDTFRIANSNTQRHAKRNQVFCTWDNAYKAEKQWNLVDNVHDSFIQWNGCDWLPKMFSADHISQVNVVIMIMWQVETCCNLPPVQFVPTSPTMSFWDHLPIKLHQQQLSEFYSWNQMKHILIHNYLTYVYIHALSKVLPP